MSVHWSTGTKLLQEILRLAREEDEYDIACVYLHVQVSNDEALKFYQRHGFVVSGTIENYYKRVEPPHCYVLRRDML